MPKKSALDKATQYVKNKLPQLGFFSTLDELIANAPFEENSLDQWRNYLKAGRVFEREGVRFPLKQEEIDYSGLMRDDLEGVRTGTRKIWSKEDLRQMIQGSRPGFSLLVGNTGLRGRGDSSEVFPEEWKLQTDPQFQGFHRRPPEVTPARYTEYAYNGLPGKYEESATRSTDFGPWDHAHFGPDVISHSRSTVHRTPSTRVESESGFGPSYTQEGRLARLVEEIQSDRHQDAHDRVPVDSQPYFSDAVNARLDGLPPPERPRVGYRTPAEEEMIRELRSRMSSTTLDRSPLLKALEKKVPDAPFKDPADYALLELRKQLLNAVNADQDFLAMVRSGDVIDRFGMSTPSQVEGTKYVYDTVYPSALKKLARQYGTEVKDVNLTGILRKLDVRPDIMRELDVEDMQGLVGSVMDHADDSPPDFRGRAFDVFDDLINEIADSTTNPPKSLQAAAIRSRQAVRQLKTDWQDGKVEIGAGSWARAVDELQYLYDRYYDLVRADVNPDEGISPKSFPGIELTPELKELVKKVGVPIWALGSLSLLGEDEKMAEGGKAEKPKRKTGLKTLGNIFAALDKPGSSGRRLKLLASGLASQVYGLDEEGQPVLGGFDSTRAKSTGSPYWALGMFRPGLIDDLVSLPAAFSDKAPDKSKAAAARMESLENQILGEMEITPPEGFGDHFAQSLGIMLGQAPAPSSAAKTGVRATTEGIKRLRDLMKKVASSPVEFLAPTVDPSLLNYGTGAGFGAILGALGSKDLGSYVPKVADESVWNRRLEDLVAKQAKGGKIKKIRAKVSFEDEFDWLSQMTDVLRPFLKTKVVPEEAAEELEKILQEESKRSGREISELESEFSRAVKANPEFRADVEPDLEAESAGLLDELRNGGVMDELLTGDISDAREFLLGLHGQGRLTDSDFESIAEELDTKFALRDADLGTKHAKGGKITDMREFLAKKLKEYDLDDPSLYDKKGNLIIEEARDLIEGHEEGIEETDDFLDSFEYDSPDDVMSEVERRVRENLNKVARVKRGEDVADLRTSLAELGKQLAEDTARAKASRTKKGVIRKGRGRITLEWAKPVSEIPDEFDGIHDDLPTSSELVEDLKGYLEASGVDPERASEFTVYQKPVFLETDSNNISHANAFWDVGWEGPEDVIAALNKYFSEE